MRKPLQNYVMTSLVFAMSSVHTLARQYLGLAGLRAEPEAVRGDAGAVVLYGLLGVDSAPDVLPGCGHLKQHLTNAHACVCVCVCEVIHSFMIIANKKKNLSVKILT